MSKRAVGAIAVAACVIGVVFALWRDDPEPTRAGRRIAESTAAEPGDPADAAFDDRARVALRAPAADAGPAPSATETRAKGGDQASLLGIVVDDATGRPIAGARVVVQSARQREALVSDGDGRFQVDMAWDRERTDGSLLRVWAVEPGYRACREQVSARMPGDADGCVRCELRLRRGWTVVGRVLDAAGAVAGARVDIHGKAGSRPFWTDREGRFYAGFPPEERCERLVAWHGARGAREQYIPAMNGAYVDVGDVTLVQTSVVACRLQFVSGQPIAGIEVLCRVIAEREDPDATEASGVRAHVATTDEFGRISLYGMRAGTVELSPVAALPGTSQVVARFATGGAEEAVVLGDIACRVRCLHEGVTLMPELVRVSWQQVRDGAPVGVARRMDVDDVCLVAPDTSWVLTAVTRGRQLRGRATFDGRARADWRTIDVEMREVR